MGNPEPLQRRVGAEAAAIQLSGWTFQREPGDPPSSSCSSWVHLCLLLLQGFNQEDLGVVEKASKAQKHQDEDESDSDEGLDRSGQE